MLCQLALYCNQIDWVQKNRSQKLNEVSVSFTRRVHFRSEVTLRIYSGFKTDRYLNRHIANIFIHEIPSSPTDRGEVELVIKTSKSFSISAVYSSTNMDLPCEVITGDFIRRNMSIEGNPTALIIPDFSISKELFAQLNFEDS